MRLMPGGARAPPGFLFQWRQATTDQAIKEQTFPGKIDGTTTRDVAIDWLVEHVIEQAKEAKGPFLWKDTLAADVIRPLILRFTHDKDEIEDLLEQVI